MAKHRKPRRTDDKYIEGVERIDATPEDLARAVFKMPVQKAPGNPKRNPRRR